MNVELVQIIAASFSAALTAMGGWEAIKYLINRKPNSRKAEAEADSVEFSVLRSQDIIIISNSHILVSLSVSPESFS